MKTVDKKLKVDCEANELGNLLRRIADTIDGRAQRSGNGFEALFEGYRKIGIKVKRKEESVSVKLKVEQAGVTQRDTVDGETLAATPAIDFSDLKKRMKSSFKQIRDSATAGRLPAPRAVRSFLQDSEKMTRHSGKGDVFYEDYLQTCHEFSQAQKDNDIEAVRRTCERLHQHRRECHQRYK